MLIMQPLRGICAIKGEINPLCHPSLLDASRRAYADGVARTFRPCLLARGARSARSTSKRRVGPHITSRGSAFRSHVTAPESAIWVRPCTGQGSRTPLGLISEVPVNRLARLKLNRPRIPVRD